MLQRTAELQLKRESHRMPGMATADPCSPCASAQPKTSSPAGNVHRGAVAAEGEEITPQEKAKSFASTRRHLTTLFKAAYDGDVQLLQQLLRCIAAEAAAEAPQTASDAKTTSDAGIWLSDPQSDPCTVRSPTSSSHSSPQQVDAASGAAAASSLYAAPSLVCTSSRTSSDTAATAAPLSAADEATVVVPHSSSLTGRATTAGVSSSTAGELPALACWKPFLDSLSAAQRAALATSLAEYRDANKRTALHFACIAAAQTSDATASAASAVVTGTNGVSSADTKVASDVENTTTSSGPHTSTKGTHRTDAANVIPAARSAAAAAGLLIACAPALLRAVDASGDTPLFFLARSRPTEAPAATAASSEKRVEQVEDVTPAAGERVKTKAGTTDAGKGGDMRAIAVQILQQKNEANKSVQEGLMEMLLRLSPSAEVNRRNAEDLTPLHCAAAADNFPAVNLLLNYGAQVNAASAHLGTPLQSAVMAGCTETAALLLRRGADPDGRSDSSSNAVDSSSSTTSSSVSSSSRCKEEARESGRALPPPVVFASSAGDAGSVELLLQAGADPNSRDAEGWTALQCAAEAGSYACVKLLLQRGANPAVETQGLTALKLALQAGDRRSITLLQQAMELDTLREEKRRSLRTSGTKETSESKITTTEEEEQRQKLGKQGQGNTQQSRSSPQTGKEEKGSTDQDLAVQLPQKDTAKVTAVIGASTASKAAAAGEQQHTEGKYEEILAEMSERKAKAEDLKQQGTDLYKQLKYSEAYEYYKQALNVCPCAEDARELRASLQNNCCLMLLHMKKNYEGALQHAKQAVACLPDASKGYYRVGQVYKAIGDDEEAAQQFWLALLREPSNQKIAQEFRAAVEEAKRKHQQRGSQTNG